MTMTNPVVSVIMIFHDSLRFMREAVESLRAQSFTDWELVLVDDGSTDGSTELAREIVANDPERVRYFEHESHANLGQAASRNLGLEVARGKFHLRLDSDDTFSSAEDLATEVALLEANPQSAMLYSRVELWRSWSGGRDEIVPLPLEERQYAPPEFLTRVPYIGCVGGNIMLARTDALRAVGGHDEQIRDYGEDYTVYAKLALHYPVLVDQRCLYRYRMHPNSFWHGVIAEGRVLEKEAALYRWLIDYLRHNGIGDRALMRAINRRFRAARYPALHHARHAVGQDLGWIICKTWVTVLRVIRRLGRLPTGDLVFASGISEVSRRTALLSVSLEWQSVNTERIEIRVGRHDGVRFLSGVRQGGQATGRWANDRLTFFLKDAGAANPDSRWATLDVARLRVAVSRPD